MSAEERAEYNRRYYQTKRKFLRAERRKQNLCIDCGVPSSKYASCFQCREKRMQVDRDRWIRRSAQTNG